MKPAASTAVVRVSRLADAAAGHQAAEAAAADAERAALAALQQDDADQRERDQQMNDQQDGRHRRVTLGFAQQATRRDGARHQRLAPAPAAV